MVEKQGKGSKRLALFLDGTWNTVSDNTNVWRLRSLIAPVSADGSEQRAFYSAGLGTKFGEKFRGGMFGRGINTAITSAYEWLVEHYEDGDEIFLFGFSRGAYTARSLSGFISKCGLLRRGAPLGVNQLYKRYRSENAKTLATILEEVALADSDRTFEEDWMIEYCQAVRIKFIGVFDTVGALGVPFPILRQITGSTYQFLNTGLRQNNIYAFHALALDEHRKAFRPTLWTNYGAISAEPRPLERTEQRWFIGAHANVGGGCFSDPLSQRPLEWMEQKAGALGLLFKRDFKTRSVDILRPVSDSYSEFAKGLYKLATLGRRHYRPLDQPPKEEGAGVKIINETIDHSVFQRWQQNAEYRPPNLVEWARAKRAKPNQIRTSLRADDLSAIA